MRKYAPLLVLFVTIASCSDDPPALTPDFVTEVRAYDLGNNGNASDIRLDFRVENNLNVVEYRLMVVPARDMIAFDLNIASSIPEVSYLRISPESFKFEYSINRLPAALLDVNGAPIQNEVEYAVTIFINGADDLQVSGFSNPFTLKDQGIYNGDYEGVFNAEIIEYLNGCPVGVLCPETGVTCPRNIDLDVSSTITLVGEKYNGKLVCADCSDLFIDQGVISFIFADNTISNFLYVQTIPCYIPGCASCVTNVDPCDATFAGQGIIVDELFMDIVFAGVDCVASQEVQLTLRRLL